MDLFNENEAKTYEFGRCGVWIAIIRELTDRLWEGNTVEKGIVVNFAQGCTKRKPPKVFSL